MSPAAGVPEASGDALSLPLTDPVHLFNAPPVDPFSEGVPEMLGMAGVEHVLQRLEMVRGPGPTALRLLLPHSEIAPGLAERIQAALHRYGQSRIEQQRVAVRETRRHGWRLTLAAVILLALFIGLSSVFASELTEGMRPLLRKTFEYGFEIVGWVMLWYPIEVLVFQPIALKTRIAALRRLIELKVVVAELPPAAATGSN